MNVDNGTSRSEPPLLSAFFSRIHLKGFNIEVGWRTWGWRSSGEQPALGLWGEARPTLKQHTRTHPHSLWQGTLLLMLLH